MAELGSFSGGGLGFGLAFTLEDRFSRTAADIQRSMSGLNGGASAAEQGINRSLDQMKLGMSAMAGGAAILAPIGLGIKEAMNFERYQTGLETSLKSVEGAKAAFMQIRKDAAATPFDVESLLRGEQALISTKMSAADARKDIMNLGNAVAGGGGTSVELSRMAINMQQIRNLGKATAVDIKQFGIAGINIYQLLADATGKSVTEARNMEVSYETLSLALEKAAGKGGLYEGAMERMSKTAYGKWTTLTDTVKFALADIGNAVMPVFHRGIDLAIQLFEGLSAFTASPFGAFIVRAAAVTAVLAVSLGGVVLVMGATRFMAYQMAGAFGSATRAQIITTLTTHGMAAGFRSMAAAAWAALLPLLPYIAAGVAIAAAFYGIYKGIQYAQAAWATLDEKANNSSFFKFFARLGGYAAVINDVWQSWNGVTRSFELTEATVKKLKALGIYENAMAVATWVLRIKEFFGGMFTSIGAAWANVSGILTKAFTVMRNIIGKVLDSIGVHLNRNLSPIEMFRKAGQILGTVIGYVFTGMAYVIAAVGVALAAVAGVIIYVGGVAANLYAKILNIGAAISEFFGGLYNYGAGLYDTGKAWVTNLWEGFKQTFIDFALWIDKAIEDIPLLGDMHKGIKKTATFIYNEAQSLLNDNGAVTGVNYTPAVANTGGTNAAAAVARFNGAQGGYQQAAALRNGGGGKPTTVHGVIQNNIILDGTQIHNVLNEYTATEQARQ